MGNQNSSFYNSTPNYATSFPTQNDTNTQPTTGDTPAKSSFYQNGGDYAALENADTLMAALATAATGGTITPLMDGAAAVGTSPHWAHEDHVHPTDTSRAPLASPALTGTPTAPTAAPSTNTTQIATTAFVLANTAGGVTLGSTTPLMNGTAAVGTSAQAAHADHVHPTDTSRAPLASPAFTGTPTAPTPTAGDNSTKIATTAYVEGQASSTTPIMDGSPTVGTGNTWARADHVHPSDTSRAPLASPTFTGTPAAPTPSVGDNSTKLATTAFVAANTVLPGYLWGLTLSAAGSTSTFSVAAGAAADSTAAVYSKLASSISKTGGSWAVGSGNGALDTGTVASSTGYHVWLIERTDLTAVDVLVSLSATAPTMPTNYTFKRRIGWMLTDTFGQWVKFIQVGDEFLWSTSVADVGVTTLGTTATLFALSVPTGVQVNALFRVTMSNATAGIGVLVSPPDQNVEAVGTPAGNCSVTNANTTTSSRMVFNIRTNTSAQIRAVASGASTTLDVVTYGWIDTRGKLY
jgi:hypothetical protein